MANSKQDESWMNFVDRTKDWNKPEKQDESLTNFVGRGKPAGCKGGKCASKPPVLPDHAYKQEAYYQQSAAVVAQLVPPAKHKRDVFDVILNVLEYISVIFLVFFLLLLILMYIAFLAGLVPGIQYVGTTLFCFINGVVLWATSRILKSVKKG